MKKLKIEIITPVHNRRDLTLRCLRSLARINRTHLDVHIIIIDDGSTDGTADAVRENFPDVEIVPGDGNLWYTGGINRGLEAALRYNPDYILTINNDSVFEENFLTHMVECAKKYPRSVIGALLLNWETPHKIIQVSPKWNVWEGGFRHWHKQTVWTIPQKPWEVEIIVGNCVLFPAEAVREAGLMDEKRLTQYGDAEYTPRMRRNGWRLLIEPRARVFCQPNEPTTGFRKLALQEKLAEMFFKSAGPYSLRRRLYMTLGSAPNRWQGFLAIPVFFIRLMLGKNAEGSWALNQNEKPLAVTFADSVVKE